MEEDLVYRLRKRAEIRRNNTERKSAKEGKPDRISDLLEEAANRIVDLGVPESPLTNAFLIEAIAGALLGSGKTCDADTWHKIMAYEAVRVLRLIGALR